MDDLNLYDDLDEFQEQQEKKSKELHEIEGKHQESLETIEKLKEEIKKLKKNIQCLELGFQSLLDTARSEIRRKDKEIERLRKEKDDICFRRKILINSPISNENPHLSQNSTLNNPFRHSNVKEKGISPNAQKETTPIPAGIRNKNEKSEFTKRNRVYNDEQLHLKEYKRKDDARYCQEEKYQYSFHHCEKLKRIEEDHDIGEDRHRNEYRDRISKKDYNRSRSRERRENKKCNSGKTNEKSLKSSNSSEYSSKGSRRSRSREHDKFSSKYNNFEKNRSQERKDNHTVLKSTSRSPSHRSKHSSDSNREHYKNQKTCITIENENPSKTSVKDLRQEKGKQLTTNPSQQESSYKPINENENSKVVNVNTKNKQIEKEKVQKSSSDIVEDQQQNKFDKIDNMDSVNKNQIELTVPTTTISAAERCQLSTPRKVALFNEIFGESPGQCHATSTNTRSSISLLDNIKDILAKTSQVEVISSATTSPSDYTDINSCMSTPINKTKEIMSSTHNTPEETIVDKTEIDNCFIPTRNLEQNVETIACVDLTKVVEDDLAMELDFVKIPGLDLCVQGRETTIQDKSINALQIQENCNANVKEIDTKVTDTRANNPTSEVEYLRSNEKAKIPAHNTEVIEVIDIEIKNQVNLTCDEPSAIDETTNCNKNVIMKGNQENKTEVVYKKSATESKSIYSKEKNNSIAIHKIEDNLEMQESVKQDEATTTVKITDGKVKDICDNLLKKIVANIPLRNPYKTDQDESIKPSKSLICAEMGINGVTPESVESRETTTDTNQVQGALEFNSICQEVPLINKFNASNVTKYISTESSVENNYLETENMSKTELTSSIVLHSQDAIKTVQNKVECIFPLTRIGNDSSEMCPNSKELNKPVLAEKETLCHKTDESDANIATDGKIIMDCCLTESHVKEDSVEEKLDEDNSEGEKTSGNSNFYEKEKSLSGEQFNKTIHIVEFPSKKGFSEMENLLSITEQGTLISSSEKSLIDQQGVGAICSKNMETVEIFSPAKVVQVQGENSSASPDEAISCKLFESGYQRKAVEIEMDKLPNQLKVIEKEKEDVFATAQQIISSNSAENLLNNEQTVVVNRSKEINSLKMTQTLENSAQMEVMEKNPTSNIEPATIYISRERHLQEENLLSKEKLVESVTMSEFAEQAKVSLIERIDLRSPTERYNLNKSSDESFEDDVIIVESSAEERQSIEKEKPDENMDTQETVKFKPVITATTFNVDIIDEMVANTEQIQPDKLFTNVALEIVRNDQPNVCPVANGKETLSLSETQKTSHKEFPNNVTNIQLSQESIENSKVGHNNVTNETVLEDHNSEEGTKYVSDDETKPSRKTETRNAETLSGLETKDSKDETAYQTLYSTNGSHLLESCSSVQETIIVDDATISSSQKESRTETNAEASNLQENTSVKELKKVKDTETKSNSHKSLNEVTTIPNESLVTASSSVSQEGLFSSKDKIQTKISLEVEILTCAVTAKLNEIKSALISSKNNIEIIPKAIQNTSENSESLPEAASIKKKAEAHTSKESILESAAIKNIAASKPEQVKLMERNNILCDDQTAKSSTLVQQTETTFEPNRQKSIEIEMNECESKANVEKDLDTTTRIVKDHKIPLNLAESFKSKENLVDNLKTIDLKRSNLQENLENAEDHTKELASGEQTKNLKEKMPEHSDTSPQIIPQQAEKVRDVLDGLPASNYIHEMPGNSETCRKVDEHNSAQFVEKNNSEKKHLLKQSKPSVVFISHIPTGIKTNKTKTNQLQTTASDDELFSHHKYLVSFSQHPSLDFVSNANETKASTVYETGPPLSILPLDKTIGMKTYDDGDQVESCTEKTTINSSRKVITKEINIDGEIVEVVKNITDLKEPQIISANTETSHQVQCSSETLHEPNKTNTIKSYEYGSQILQSKLQTSEAELRNPDKVDNRTPVIEIPTKSNENFSLLHNQVQCPATPQLSTLPTITTNLTETFNTASELPSISTTSPTPSNFSGIFSKKSSPSEEEILKSKKKSPHLTAKIKEYILPAVSVLCNVDNLENATKSNKKLHWELLDNKNEMTEIEDDADIDTTDEEQLKIKEDSFENTSSSPQQNSGDEKLTEGKLPKSLASETDTQTECQHKKGNYRKLKKSKVQKIKQCKQKLPKTVKARLRAIAKGKPEAFRDNSSLNQEPKRSVGRPRKQHENVGRNVVDVQLHLKKRGRKPKTTTENLKVPQKLSSTIVLNSKLDNHKGITTAVDDDIKKTNSNNVESFDLQGHQRPTIFAKSSKSDRGENNVKSLDGSVGNAALINSLDNSMTTLSSSVERLEICEKPFSSKDSIIQRITFENRLKDFENVDFHKKQNFSADGVVTSTKKSSSAECNKQLEESRNCELTKSNVSPKTLRRQAEDEQNQKMSLATNSLISSGTAAVEEAPAKVLVEEQRVIKTEKSKSVAKPFLKKNSTKNKNTNFISLEDIGIKVRPPKLHLSSYRIPKIKKNPNDAIDSSWKLETYVEIENAGCSEQLNEYTEQEMKNKKQTEEHKKLAVGENDSHSLKSNIIEKAVNEVGRHKIERISEEDMQSSSSKTNLGKRKLFNPGDESVRKNNESKSPGKLQKPSAHASSNVTCQDNCQIVSSNTETKNPKNPINIHRRILDLSNEEVNHKEAKTNDEKLSSKELNKNVKSCKPEADKQTSLKEHAMSSGLTTNKSYTERCAIEEVEIADKQSDRTSKAINEHNIPKEQKAIKSFKMRKKLMHAETAFPKTTLLQLEQVANSGPTNTIISLKMRRKSMGVIRNSSNNKADLNDAEQSGISRPEETVLNQNRSQQMRLGAGPVIFSEQNSLKMRRKSCNIDKEFLNIQVSKNNSIKSNDFEVNKTPLNLGNSQQANTSSETSNALAQPIVISARGKFTNQRRNLDPRNQESISLNKREDNKNSEELKLVKEAAEEKSQPTLRTASKISLIEQNSQNKEKLLTKPHELNEMTERIQKNSSQSKISNDAIPAEKLYSVKTPEKNFVKIRRKSTNHRETVECCNADPGFTRDIVQAKFAQADLGKATIISKQLAQPNDSSVLLRQTKPGKIPNSNKALNVEDKEKLELDYIGHSVNSNLKENIDTSTQLVQQKDMQMLGKPPNALNMEDTSELEHSPQKPPENKICELDSDSSAIMSQQKTIRIRRKSRNQLRIIDSSSDDGEPVIKKPTVIPNEIKIPITPVAKPKPRRRRVVKVLSTSIETPANITNSSQQSCSQSSPLASPNHPIFNTEVSIQSTEFADSLPKTPNQQDDDNKLKEIDSKLHEIFQSPINTTEYKISPTVAVEVHNVTILPPSPLNEMQPSVTPVGTLDLNQENDQSTLNNTQLKDSITDLNDTTTVHNNSEIKHLSLGSSEYRFEKVSDNVINLFISRKRKRKRDN